MTPRSLRPFLAAGLFALHGCTLDRSAIAGMPGAVLSAEPSLACPGDTVVIAWDTRRPHHPGFCRFANGNTPALQSCTVSSECGGGGAICLDGFCNDCRAIADERRRLTECAAPSNQGCQPSLSARIQVTPEPDPPLADATGIFQHEGERSFVIQQTSTIAFRSEVIDTDGERAGVAGSIGRIDLDRQVTVVNPDLSRTLANAYECQGRPSWPGMRLEELFAGASPTLRLLDIRNPNRFTVVGNVNGSPLRLGPGENISLSLPLSGPVQGQPDPDFLRTLPPVICTATHSSGSYPSAPLQLTVGCVAD
ncbi:hypothetical protein [Pseudomonas sp. F(2018)]|uniref:hypothetical protein n=1 Tax=Pseudomonas sp. F(2018) TaxID=2502240 RepID=UPI0010F5D38F|nr:hypothetical protein [Pseudomonas sp. F(2018)]